MPCVTEFFQVTGGKNKEPPATQKAKEMQSVFLLSMCVCSRPKQPPSPWEEGHEAPTCLKTAIGFKTQSFLTLISTSKVNQRPLKRSDGLTLSLLPQANHKGLEFTTFTKEREEGARLKK